MLSNQTCKHSQNLTVLAFHKMQVHFSYGSNNYTPTKFENLLKYLIQNNYSFVSIDELEGEVAPKSVLITFDDGYAHLCNHLPAFIKTYKIKPLIFIPTKFIGESNSWDYSYFFQKSPHMDINSIKKLSNIGVDFGTHSHSHCDLSSLSKIELKKELLQSKNILEDIIEKNINSICYPFGRYNQKIISLSKELGYTYGFTMKFPQSSDNYLSIGRYPIYGFDNLFTIKQKIERGKLYHCQRFLSRAISSLSSGTILLNKLRKI